MTIDTAISLAGVIVLAALIAVLVKKQIFRELPVFLFYLAWGLLDGVVAVATMRYFPHLYLGEWIGEACANTVVFLLALVELRNKLGRYNRTSPSGWSLLFFLFALNGLVLKSLSGWSVPSHYPVEWRFSVHTMQVTAVLELAALLALIEWTVIRRFHWPNRELRIVSGFGVSGIVSITIAILCSHAFLYSGQRYRWAGLLIPACNLGVLVYWLWYFVFEDGKVAEGAESRAKAVGAGAPEGQNDVELKVFRATGRSEPALR